MYTFRCVSIWCELLALQRSCPQFRAVSVVACRDADSRVQAETLQRHCAFLRVHMCYRPAATLCLRA
eukprot:6741541-Alexandrium_andersonii.AAC.1